MEDDNKTTAKELSEVISQSGSRATRYLHYITMGKDTEADFMCTSIFPFNPFAQGKQIRAGRNKLEKVI